MLKINTNFQKLAGSYLFAEVARRSDAFMQQHPDQELIRLGIGDVTRPLPAACTKAMAKAAEEMGTADGFRGYGPYEGYAFLRKAIATHDYLERGVRIQPEEIFVSDGAKSDTASIQELLAEDAIVGVTNPVYPVYVDSNVIAGRSGAYNDKTEQYDGIVYLPATEENGFAPPLPSSPVDVVYLCSPGNPTGTALSKTQLIQWVDWANKNGSLILYDGAYERFIADDNIPRSIFEIEGARTCAIEFRSYSKTAGFTGTRCAYTVIPRELMGADDTGNEVSLNELWMRRQSTKFNGVSYMIQRGAEAVYSPEGAEEVEQIIAAYMENADIIRKGLLRMGLSAYGGVHSPYIWLKTPHQMKSWDFFDKLLTEAGVVGTPGSGFGSEGEGYFRLTAFNTKENTQRAMDRISGLQL